MPRSTATPPALLFFFFNDTATTEIYTLSLHDALPIFHSPKIERIEVTAIGDVNRAKLYYLRGKVGKRARVRAKRGVALDRKSTRLNSSHSQISYAVFCLKKKKHPPIHARSTTRQHLVF